jgi:hypothetical protein
MPMSTNSGAIQRAEQRRSTRRASKGWKNSGAGKTYTKLHHAIFQSPQYAKLSQRAVKLMVDLMAQYRGTNNGNLTSAWSVMQAAGWRSKDLLRKACDELEKRGWAVKTRQGSINAPTLWALTFFGIDDCRDKQGNRKMDAGITPDTMPLHLWQQPEFDMEATKSKRQFKKKRPAREPGKPFPRAGKADDENKAKVVDLTPHLSREPVQ